MKIIMIIATLLASSLANAGGAGGVAAEAVAISQEPLALLLWV